MITRGLDSSVSPIKNSLEPASAKHAQKPRCDDSDMDPGRETHNPNLYAALRTYAIDSLEVIRTHDWRSTSGLPTHLWQKAKITSQGMASYLTAEVDWSVILSSCEAELRQLSAHKVAENAMRSDARVARHLDTMVGDSQRMMRVDINTCFRSFLLRLVADQQDASFVEDKFDRIFREMEDYFESSILRRRIVAPLTNFSMEGETVALGDGLSIKRLSLAEREEFASRSVMFPLTPFGSHGPTGWEEFALDFYAEVPKVIGERIVPSSGQGLFEVATEKCDEALAGLRLFKAGGVSYNSVNLKIVAWESVAFGGSILKPAVPSIGPRYELTKDEIPAFQNFWGGFRRQRSRKRLRTSLALRRFNLAYERALPEDRLIDYAIALEALLLRREELQELAYRLALRGSALLGENPDTRFEIFSRLKTAYSIRSDVVHGGSPPPRVSVGSTQISFHQFVEEIGGDVRSAVMKMLALTESTEEVEVIGRLDEKIARGERP